MIYYVKGNLLDPEYKVFCHQVNCQKVMGAGLARQIKEKYPEVYQEYEDREYPFLGAIDWIHTHDDRICVNMYAQEDYGRYERHTDYIGFAQCLVELSDYLLFLTTSDAVLAVEIGELYLLLLKILKRLLIKMYIL